ncbi:purple acid phosphatase family protein [Singulisphaera acidiphila]|uniref:Phosphodiesterase/alkaline phosphatase D n=1 Tax=Singulisphaera acidiphila (strain ATCC BAA-1392 / DSM 18658 / VKM B-2454 / MOB10) TaxID=886293 RepID=L0DPB6_SINAD|nr:metallophosphoesterase family protein [Singulisphaera acidiphila]AGA30516.1 phosphodiesterase/alkaline phosphatase D [Singulisphaera acidiphila DSM 18658]
MNSLDRRTFMSTTLGGLSMFATGTLLLAQDRDAKADAEGKPNTLFLTWQRDPTTTMTVQWIAPAADEGATVDFAEFGKAGATQSVATKQTPYPMTNLRVFRAELTGLSPGAEYQFQINKKGPAHRFRTMPAKATDSFQFVSGGDCDVNEHAIANNILAAKQNPMFALIGGDLGYDNGISVERSLAFLRNYSQHMIDAEGRLIPMVVCIGNHEVKGSYGQSRKESPFYLAVHDGLYAERTFATLDFGDYLSLILLDTGHIAPIDGEQTDWLDKALAERSERPHVIAVNHVPAYPSFRKFEAEGGKAGTGELNRTQWVPLFERHNVDLVLEHHDHTFKRTHPLKDGMVNANGILYLGDGSWGKLRSPASPEQRPYLAKTSEAYHMTLHRFEGEQRFHMALQENGRVIDICTTQKRPRRVAGRKGL